VKNGKISDPLRGHFFTHIDIAGRFSAIGLKSEYSGRKWPFSNSVHENILQTIVNTATVVIGHQ